MKEIIIYEENENKTIMYLENQNILEKYEENSLVSSTSFFNSNSAILFNSCLSDNIVFKSSLPFFT